MAAVNPNTGATQIESATLGVAKNGAAVTKSDSTVLAYRALWVGGAGDVAVIFIDDVTNAGAGTAVTLSGVPAGTLLPVSVKRVMAATTATLIVGLA